MSRSCATAAKRNAARWSRPSLVAWPWLNGPTRAALSTLRGGGNRSGAEAVTTWQTGLRLTSRGAAVPAKRRARTCSRRRGGGSAGRVTSVPEGLRAGLGRVPVVLVGPRASEAPFAARVAIDTSVAGIHEAGLGYRMDEVPLPLRAAVPGPRAAAETLRELAGRLARPLAETGR
jgi:formylmethanofuran dehydrogenase subunit B